MNKMFKLSGLVISCWIVR